MFASHVRMSRSTPYPRLPAGPPADLFSHPLSFQCNGVAKEKNNRINPFILALICACLLFAFYMSASTLLLAWLGDSVSGVVDSYDSRRDDGQAEQNRSRTISMHYHFSVSGKTYRGFAMYSSDEAWPRLQEGEVRTERIRYLPSLPVVNKPARLTDLDRIGSWGILYHLLAIPGYVLLGLLAAGLIGKKKAKSKQNNKSKQKGKHMDTKTPKASRFCKNCGARLDGDAMFCANCGAALQPSAPAAPPAAAAPRIGFSPHSTHPEILAAAVKNRKTARGCLWALVVIPLVGFPLAGLLLDDMPLGEAVIIGVGIALVMLVVNLVAMHNARKPVWEGTVISRDSKKKQDRYKSDDTYTSYMEFTTRIRTDTGKTKRIVERDSGRHMYDYLAVGDRVRFHPAFGTYEKYDKTHDRVIYCNVCSMMNPIENDRCARCSNLLFK